MKTRSMNDEAVSPVIAVILMVAITVVLAATVFVLVSDIGNQTGPGPAIAFHQDLNAGNLTVTSAPGNLLWSEFTVTGCTTIPTGALDAGDVIQGCDGDVVIKHNATNSLTYRGTF